MFLLFDVMKHGGEKLIESPRRYRAIIDCVVKRDSGMLKNLKSRIASHVETKALMVMLAKNATHTINEH